MLSPLTCDVYDKSLAWLGRIANPVSISGSVRYNAMGSFEFRIRADDPMADDIMAKGARISITYRDQPLMSGVVRTKQGSLLPNGDIIFQVQDDWRMLVNTVALIAPFQSLAPTSLESTVSEGWGQAHLPGGGSDAGPNGTTQGQFGFYFWRDGSAQSGGVIVNTSETAIKRIIQENLLSRLKRPISIAADQQRGGDARAAGMLPLIRMSNVAEGVMPILEWSGLHLRLIQAARATTVSVEVYQPTVWAAELTTESSIVTDGPWSLKPPNSTRSIIGGPGEGVDRAFWEVRDKTGLEDEYGDIIEVFRDATAATLDWPASISDPYKVAKYFLLRTEVANVSKTIFTNYLNTSGAKGLTEGLPVSGVQATLSESESFYFGGIDGIQLGDTVNIKAASGVVFSERITEAKFSLTSTGFTVEPILGQKSDDTNQQLARAIAGLAASQRKLSANR